MIGLIIVESPTKARKILAIVRGLNGFADTEWTVLPTMGHVRDLPDKAMGINLKLPRKASDPKVMAPRWVLGRKGSVMKAIHEAAKKSDVIYLATDPDAEGESISWHVYSLIAGGLTAAQKLRRITFTEITIGAIRKALSEPRQIDMNRAQAAVSRRVVDRLVGYGVSPALWQAFNNNGLAAGRVQSVVLHWLCQRERAIRQFTPETFYCLSVTFDGSDKPRVLRGEKRYETAKAAEADRKRLLDMGEPTTTAGGKSERYAPPPFDTASLIRTASAVLGVSSASVMDSAQSLFEQGKITYHRTESRHLSWGFVSAARAYIERVFGKAYLTPKPKNWPAKGGHEAIRPTNVTTLSNDIQNELDAKLYDLIWRRAVACQAPPAEIEHRTLTWGDPAIVKLVREHVSFSGWMEIAGGNMPVDDLDAAVEVTDASVEQDVTRPPRPYTESDVVSQMESEGIGRPSTYAATVQRLLRHGYIRPVGKTLRSTQRGEVTDWYIGTRFPSLTDAKLTANMERALDRIADGSTAPRVVTGACWFWLSKQIGAAKRSARADTFVRCPKCESEMDVVMRFKGSPHLKCKACKAFASLDITDDGLAAFVDRIVAGTCKVCHKTSDQQIKVSQSKYGVYERCTTCQEIQRDEASRGSKDSKSRSPRSKFRKNRTRREGQSGSGQRYRHQK